MQISDGNRCSDFLKHVVRVWKSYEDDKKKLISDPPNLKKYTGLSENEILNIEQINIDQCSNINTIERSLIRNELFNFYLNQKKMPHTMELFNALNNKIPVGTDIRELRKVLLKMGYVWMKINKHCPIIENPAVTFERFHYLSKLKDYRDNNVPTLYVCCFLWDWKTKSINYDLEKKSDVKYLIYFNIFCVCSREGINFVSSITNASKNKYKDWLEHVISNMGYSQPVLFVFSNTVLEREVLVKIPTLQNLRSDIADWLNYHNVPFEDEMSKIELYDLARKFTDMDKNIYVVNNLLGLHGHHALHLPYSINYVTQQKYILDYLNKMCINAGKKPFYCENPEKDLKEIPKELVNDWINQMIEDEIRIFDEDKQFDNNYDSLVEESSVEYVDCDDISVELDSDIPDISDSE